MRIILTLAIAAVCGAVLFLGQKPKETRKLRIAVCLLLCLVFSVLFILLSPEKDPWAKHLSKHRSLGVPYSEFFTDEQKSSRITDDLIIFDGRLYVGGGDYDKNTGPLPIISYDLEKGIWESSDELIPDEQIKRFTVLDERLVATGTDPKDDWELGNYYVFKDGKWETLRALPNGVHCFDAIEFGGESFFALGVTSHHFPVVRFDGENYVSVEFFRNGELLDTSSHETIRVYNLFEYMGELYAFLTLDQTNENGEMLYFMDLYVYDGKAFNYKSGRLPSFDMREVAVADEKIFFIIDGTLLSSRDLLGFSAVSLGEGASAVDITESDGEIYVLATKSDGDEKHLNAIFRLTSDGDFDIVLSFKTDIEAGAFCTDGNSFFVSLGRRESESQHASVGQVIKISAKADK